MKPAPKAVPKAAPKAAAPANKAAPAHKAAAPIVNKAAPAKQAEPAQQIQQQQQVVAPVVPVDLDLKFTQTIKLPQMLNVIQDDKEQNLITLLIDTTGTSQHYYEGNAYNFFKYKGTLIDVNEMVMEEHLKGKKREENVEIARRRLVGGLKGGATVVFASDMLDINMNDFYKSEWFKPELIFKYSTLFSKDYYKNVLITKEEDVDSFGNHGWYEPQEREFQLVLLLTSKDETLTPEVAIHKVGFAHIKKHFKATKIVE